MRTKLVINLDLMKQKSGSVTSFCDKNNFNRQVIYNLNGSTRINSEKNKALANELIDRGLASWEIIEKESVA